MHTFCAIKWNDDNSPTIKVMTDNLPFLIKCWFILCFFIYKFSYYTCNTIRHIWLNVMANKVDSNLTWMEFNLPSIDRDLLIIIHVKSFITWKEIYTKYLTRNMRKMIGRLLIMSGSFISVFQNQTFGFFIYLLYIYLLHNDQIFFIVCSNSLIQKKIITPFMKASGKILLIFTSLFFQMYFPNPDYQNITSTNHALKSKKIWK